MDGVVIRPGGEDDFDGWFDLFESVAAEDRWIGRELPLDRAEFRARFRSDFVEGTMPAVALLAVAGRRIVGMLDLRTRGGLADIGMAVAANWRCRGVGTDLMAAAVDWAHSHDVYKITLQLWPHNHAARALYEKFGFVQEGYLRRQYRRRSGELWDAVIMGLVLDETSPGSTIPAG
jgi:RimJ/RimL family protein N-acetyltransferase